MTQPKPLRCQRRDTSAFSHKSVGFRVPLLRTEAEWMGNCGQSYRKFAAQVFA